MTLKWESFTHGSGSLVRIGRLVHASVSWSNDSKNPGYQVKVGDVTLQKLSPDMPDGQKRAEMLARKLIQEALNALDS